jgi:hypothetical protein
MDGLKFVVPGTCKPRETLVKEAEITLLGGSEEAIYELRECEGCKNIDTINNSKFKHTGIYSNIMNWETGELEPFVEQGEKNG